MRLSLASTTLRLCYACWLPGVRGTTVCESGSVPWMRAGPAVQGWRRDLSLSGGDSGHRGIGGYEVIRGPISCQDPLQCRFRWWDDGRDSVAGHGLMLGVVRMNLRPIERAHRPSHRASSIPSNTTWAIHSGRPLLRSQHKAESAARVGPFQSGDPKKSEILATA